MLLFIFLFYSSLYGLSLGHETEGRGQKEETEIIASTNVYVALCLGMLLLFCVLKGSQD